jgi:riboflavin synthase
VVAVFTGLIGDVGEVRAIERRDEGARIAVETSLAPDLVAGASIAVNGACLTAAELTSDSFTADAMNQTLTMTTLGGLSPGSAVNLELAMRLSDRLGGHIVQGHVDGVAAALGIAEDGISRRLRLALDRSMAPYLIAQGSVAVDGVSLTVADLGEDWFEVALIPETLEHTTLGAVAAGDQLNIECDLIAKHLERLMSPLTGKEES